MYHQGAQGGAGYGNLPIPANAQQGYEWPRILQTSRFSRFSTPFDAATSDNKALMLIFFTFADCSAQKRNQASLSDQVRRFICHAAHFAPVQRFKQPTVNAIY